TVRRQTTPSPGGLIVATSVDLSPAGNRFAGQPGRHQPNRRSGRTQAADPTPAPTEGWGSRAGSTIHTIPAEYVCAGCGDRSVVCVQILQLWRAPQPGPALAVSRR